MKDLKDELAKLEKMVQNGELDAKATPDENRDRIDVFCDGMNAFMDELKK